MSEASKQSSNPIPLAWWKTTMSTHLAELAGEVKALCEVVMALEQRIAALESNQDSESA